MAEQKHWWIKRRFSSIYLSLWLLVWVLTNWLIVALYLMTDMPPCTCCYMFLFFPLAFTFFNPKITLPLLINIGKWNVIYNARRNQSHRPTSPNTAPATQNKCHQWSASHMKRHFQCVEQVKSPSNLTKYCACHEILKLKISADTPWMLPPIERRFDDNPRISEDKIVISHPPLRGPYSSHLGDDFVL